MTTIDIKAEYAALIEPFESTDDTRYYLQGFYVEPCAQGGVLIVASNGHVLGIFHDESGRIDGPPVIVGTLDKAIRKASSPKARREYQHVSSERRLMIDGKTARIVERDASVDPPAEISILGAQAGYVDGTFSDWRLCIKSTAWGGSPPKPAAFNVALLKRFEGIRDFECSITTLKLSGDNPAGPFWALTNREDFVGVIMPMTGRDIGEAPPTWLGLQSTNKEEKAA